MTPDDKPLEIELDRITNAAVEMTLVSAVLYRDGKMAREQFAAQLRINIGRAQALTVEALRGHMKRVQA